jgi:hypothetical protein
MSRAKEISEAATPAYAYQSRNRYSESYYALLLECRQLEVAEQTVKTAQSIMGP